MRYLQTCCPDVQVSILGPDTWPLDTGGEKNLTHGNRSLRHTHQYAEIDTGPSLKLLSPRLLHSFVRLFMDFVMKRFVFCFVSWIRRSVSCNNVVCGSGNFNYYTIYIIAKKAVSNPPIIMPAAIFVISLSDSRVNQVCDVVVYSVTGSRDPDIIWQTVVEVRGIYFIF